MCSYEEQEEKIEWFDKRIEEIAEQECYNEEVKRMNCFLGIKIHTALSLIVENGDFERYAKGNTYVAFLGLAPGESSSGEQINRTCISKVGNSHLRLMLGEVVGGMCKGARGHKFKKAEIETEW